MGLHPGCKETPRKIAITKTALSFCPMIFKKGSGYIVSGNYILSLCKSLGHVGSIEGSPAQALPKLQAAAAHFVLPPEFPT